VLAALDAILREQGDSLIVAHGGSLRIIISHLSGWGMGSLHSFELEPGSLTILEHYDESTVVQVLNDTCHLKTGEAI
jgi:broad specificity phosphatase PhoE